ncbi:MAG TPA: hypothetical protein VJS64_10235 [Pyrinomonadaceae bacterium]|nr:hypothetical protein [Pyrinomonadaceae bacterium]
MNLPFPSLTNRRSLLLLDVGIACVLLSQCATVGETASSCDRIRVTSNALSLAEAEQYCHYATGERQKVETFWGGTWSEIIHIDVDDRYKISRALTTKTRGFMEMPLTVVRAQRSALLHEIVHVYAPNTNRFLAEGLAAYLQQQLGGNPAFPNFGRDLRELARHRLSALTSLEALNNVRTPRPLRSVMQEQTAYILAGSFVQFLIGNYGLTMLRNLYEVGSYDLVYSKDLAALEREWRIDLQR